MTGTEKMDAVVIGKSKQPRAFRKVDIKNMRFHYYNNDTSSQNRSTFLDWFRRFDLQMHGRRVLLLLDNASCHTVTYKCYSVVVKFFPPIKTAHAQPLDAGIIRSFKAPYRRKLVRWLLGALHANVVLNINILEAIRFAISSWEEIPDQVIQNCWMKCDIVDAVTTAQLIQLGEYDHVVGSNVEHDLEGLMAGLSCTVSVDKYIDVDRGEREKNQS